MAEKFCAFSQSFFLRCASSAVILNHAVGEILLILGESNNHRSITLTGMLPQTPTIKSLWFDVRQLDKDRCKRTAENEKIDKQPDFLHVVATSICQGNSKVKMSG